MNYKKGQNLTKWILILPIVGFIITAFLFIQTFINYEKNSYKNELRLNNTQTIKINKLFAKTKVEEIFDFIQLNTQSLKLEAKEDSKEMVNYAYKIIENVYEHNKNLPKNKILQLISNKLNDMRFFKHLDGYFYITNMQGTMLMHPIDSSLIGKNLLSLKDVKGKMFIKEAIRILETKNQDEHEYYWRKGNSKKIVKKYVSIKKFAALDIFISTGRYEDNILRDIKNRIQKILINMRYGEKGYIFAYDGKGNTISHIKKEFIGINRWNSVVHDEHLVRQLIRGAKSNEEGFFKSYIARFDPVTKTEAYKISYIKYVPEFDWIIGTGVYGKDVQEELKEKEKSIKENFNETISNLIWYSFVILIIILIGTYFIFTKLRIILKNYQDNLIEYNLKTTQQKENLSYQLRHDILTSLANRILLNERLNDAIIRAKRNKKSRKEVYR